MTTTDRSAQRRRLVRVVATVASAVLIIHAFPPRAFRSLALVALVPFLWAVRRARPLEAAVLGALWAMVGAYGVAGWLPRAVSAYYGQPVWLGGGLFVIASFLMGAVEYAAFAVFYRYAAGRRMRFVPLLAGAAWSAAELGRARLFTGNPWGLLAYTQSGVAPGEPLLGWRAGVAPLWLIQVADLGGVYVIAFVLVTVNAVLVEILARSWKDRARPRGRALSEVVLPLALAVAAWVYGAVHVANDRDADGTGVVEAAVVQGNLDLGSRWREDMDGRNLDLYLHSTQEVIASDHPSIVFWPENAMTFFVDDEPLYRRAIASVTKPAGVELVAGAPRHESPGDPRYFNSVFVLAPDGTVTDHYDKEQLLPFAEYFPFASVDLLKRSFARVREFTPGARTAPLATRAGAAGITVCNEAMFPRLVRRRVLAGADYLVNLSNDTWIADPDYAEHQLALMALRAVEFRRMVVRASTSGPSAFVDRLGRVVARTNPQSRSVLVYRVRANRQTTAYARLGDAFAFACLGVAVLTALLGRAPKRRRTCPASD